MNRSMTGKNDEILKRIEVFNKAHGGGVVIQKAARGYSLFREENGKPIARLRTFHDPETITGIG